MDFSGEHAPATQPGFALQRASIMLLLPVALWIWLCWDWPARLGFYCDDWMILLHPFVGTREAFRDLARDLVTRPVSIPFVWLAQVIVDWSPVRSQVLNAAMLLVTAASVGLLAAELTSAVSGLRHAALVGASVAAAAFIIFPSTVGTFAWGVGVIAVVPALPLFCIGMTLILRSEGHGWKLALGLLMTLLSHLSYEAFYFQEITFVLIAAVLGGRGIKDLPWTAIVGAILINVGCVLFNRLTAGGVHKTFYWDFLHAFAGGYRSVLAILGHAAREHKILIGISVLTAGLAGALCLAQRIGHARVQIALLLTICGVVAAGLLYAFAGYSLAAEGPMARVSIVLATYYSIASGLLAAAAWGARNRLPALLPASLPPLAFWVFAAISFGGLAVTDRYRVGEWADTWSHELARLSRLPASITTPEASASAGQRIYLAVEERTPAYLEPATATYEITGAVAWAIYQHTNSRLSMIDIWRGSQTVPRWFGTAYNWFNRWDGKNFEQGPCQGPVAGTLSGTELWTWDTSSGALVKVEPPWQLGCQ